MKKSVFKQGAGKQHADLVGLDFSTTATKVVRLRKVRGVLGLAGIDLLPAVDFKEAARRFELPRNMNAYYGRLTYTGTEAVVRMINAPLPSESDALPETKLRELLNVSEDYRVAAYTVKQGKGRQDSIFLAAAIPEDDARFLLGMFPSGSPAPAAIEVAGLSFISAFLHARKEECAQGAICLIEAGETVSYFAFLNKGIVVLVGRFAFGGRVLRNRVVKDLGVDDELAANILNDRSINLATTLADVMTPFMKQLSISKDFIERHQGCRISKIYVSGGVSLLPNWLVMVEQMLHTPVAAWSPFEKIQYDQDMIPANLAGQMTRFAAAVGAAIGGIEIL